MFTRECGVKYPLGPTDTAIDWPSVKLPFGVMLSAGGGELAPATCTTIAADNETADAAKTIHRNRPVTVPVPRFTNAHSTSRS